MVLPGFKKPKEKVEEKEKSSKLSPFDIINHINSKGGFELDSDIESQYNPFITNKFYSFFADTVMHAAEMTLAWELDNKMQYDYYYRSLPRGKRFTKWVKGEQDPDLKLIMDHYKVNARRAQEMKMITQLSGHDIIKEIKEQYGGQ